MAETAETFSEIDITERSFTDQTKAKESKEIVENTLSQCKKYEDGKSEARFEDNLPEQVETNKCNLDMVISNGKNEEPMAQKFKLGLKFKPETRKPIETKSVLPEFQFVERDFSDSNNTECLDTNSKAQKLEDYLTKHENTNEMDNFKQSKKMGQNEKSENATADLKAMESGYCSRETTKKFHRKFTILHEDDFSDGESAEEVAMVAILRSTISELERALRDSRALIKTRDEDIAGLRKEVEKGHSVQIILTYLRSSVLICSS